MLRKGTQGGGAGAVMQLALGAVYACDPGAWLRVVAGGAWMRRAGPRRVALVGGVCYGLGTILAGQAGGNIGLLYLRYGVLGGIGLGLAYIVPLATSIKWSPDKRG